MAHNEPIQNDEVRLFGTETGKHRWWRFVQVVKISIGASVPDAEEIALVNVHSPSSNRAGTWHGRAFGSELNVQTKTEMVRRPMALYGQDGRVVLAGDTNMKRLSELEAVTDSDAHG